MGKLYGEGAGKMKRSCEMIKSGLVTLYLLALSIYDGREKRVPVLLLGIGILGAAAWMLGKGIQGDLRQCLLGVIPGLFLLFIAWITKKAGCADGAVLSVIGVFEGYQGGMIIWGMSLCAVSVCAIILLCARRAGRDTQLPYIPFLCGGYIVWKVLGG